MNCFGDIQKIPADCDGSFCRYHRRFVPAETDDEILVTESPNLVIKYDIRNGQISPIQSWTFKEFYKLSVPMTVHGDGTGKLVGIHAGNTVIEWKLNDKNDGQLEPTFSRKFQNKIINLFSFRHHPDPLLVFDNGWVEFLSRIKDEAFPSKINSSAIEANEKIIGMDMNLQSKKKRFFLFLIVTDSEENFHVYKCTILKDLAGDPLIPAIRHTKKSRLNSVPEAWCYLPHLPMMAGASKTGQTINVFSLEPPIDQSKNESVFQLECSSQTLNSLATCHGGAIGVLGKKSDNDFRLEVYEAHYHVKIALLNLEKTILPWSFCAIGENFFIACTNSIIMVPIVNQKFLLSQLLTKSIQANHQVSDTGDDSLKSANFIKFKQILGFPENENEPLTTEKLDKINIRFKNCLKQGDQIPENIIVFMLDVVTKNLLDCDEENLELREKLKLLFEDLVEIPYNQVFLVSCLKSSNLSVDQCLLSIDLLLDLLPSKNTFLMSWISIVLDANYNKFIVKPEPKIVEALEKIFERVSNNIQFFERLGTIQTFRDAIIKKAKTFLSAITDETPPVGQYSIELITLT